MLLYVLFLLFSFIFYLQTDFDFLPILEVSYERISLQNINIKNYNQFLKQTMYFEDIYSDEMHYRYILFVKSAVIKTNNFTWIMSVLALLNQFICMFYVYVDTKFFFFFFLHITNRKNFRISSYTMILCINTLENGSMLISFSLL